LRKLGCLRWCAVAQKEQRLPCGIWPCRIGGLQRWMKTIADAPHLAVGAVVIMDAS
jgi:hypothetical protein